MKAAVIGLGSMGSGIAKSLLRAGVETVGYDTDETARQALVASGGTAINELDALPADCDIALVVVVNAEQVEQVLGATRSRSAPANRRRGRRLQHGVARLCANNGHTD